MLTLNCAWEYFIIMLESLFLLVFMEDKMLHTDKLNSKISFLFKIFYIIADSIRTIIFNQLNITYEINYLISFFCFILFAIIFYNAKFSVKIFFSAMYLSILFVSDTIAASLFQFFSKNNPTASLIGGPLRLPATLTYVCCIACFVFLSHFVRWKIFSPSPIGTIFYIVICIIGFFIGEYIVSITIESFSLFNNILFTNKLEIISTIYTLLFLILLAYIYLLDSMKAQNQRLLEDKQQLIIEEISYRNLIESTNSLRKMKHDIQHHLSLIQYYIQYGDINELSQYINQYMGSFNNIHRLISTGNTAIDCILSTYIQKAEENNIRVNFSLTVPDTFNLDPILTTSLLGNLWTNAISACTKLVENNNEAVINFYIKPFENMLLISIENTYNGLVKKDYSGNYISTKSNYSHGIGLKRVNEIVENNDGILEITDNNNLFCVHITFPIEG